MKNKKLFAILTLVCFMFTLMPVAAFAAPTTYVDIDDEYELVNVDEAVVVNVGPIESYEDGDQLYVFAVNSAGAMYKYLDVVEINNIKLGSKNVAFDVAGVEYINLTDKTVANDYVPFVVKFADADDYTVYVVEANDAVDAIVDNDELTRAQKVALLKDEAFTNLDATVTVKDKKTAYHFCGDATHEADVDTTVTIEKANGVAFKTVELYLHDAAGDAVVGKEVTISTNSSAVDVSKTKVTTDAAGRVKFDVTASIAGEYKVYVEFGNKADAILDVTAGTTGPADIETKYNGTKVDLDTDLSRTNMMFTITDINGNIINDEEMLDENGKEFYVKVTQAPAGSAVTNTALKEAELKYNANESAWYLYGVELDEEGDYEFKVILDNGAYATASVTVKEFQTPVSIKLTYQAPSVELNGYNYLKDLKFVDANGVETTKGTEEIKLAANGYAVDSFAANATAVVASNEYQIKVEVDGKEVWKTVNKLTYDATQEVLVADNDGIYSVANKRIVPSHQTLGTVKAKADESYIGSTITVTAVSQKYNLVAAVSMVVANEAAEVKYATTEADVAVNNTLVANIVDKDGNKVALNKAVGKASISYVVLEKPENAKVAVSTLTDGNLANKGEFKVSFTANEIGSYKVQTIVTYEQADGVVKYYTGIETITVGNTGFEDIVVMSIGSNEIVVNTDTKEIPAAPIVENNRTFVPFRALIEAFGAEVAWDEATQAVTAELNDTVVVMTIGSATYTVNGVEKSMDVAPFIKDASTMIPVRFVAEEFGITVTPTYDNNGATADILFAK